MVGSAPLALRRVQARIDRIDRALDRLGYAAPDVGHEPAAADGNGQTTRRDVG